MVDRREKKKEEEVRKKKEPEAQRAKALKKYACWTGTDGKRYTSTANVRVYELSDEDLTGVTVLQSWAV